MFDYFDKKHTGYISAKQIGTTLRSLKPAPDEFIVLQKIDEIDHDYKGKVNFQQYLDVLHSVIRKSKQNKRKRVSSFVGILIYSLIPPHLAAS